MLTLRTPQKAVEYFKERDEGTCVTLSCIRRLIAEGSIPTIKVGVKNLVAIEHLEKYFEGGDVNA